MRTPYIPTLSALAVAALLAACGGGDDATTSTAAGGGTLTLSATTPADLATSLDLSTATTKGNSTRAADGFSSVPYCEVFWENVNGANGKTYAVQVYFRQADKQPINISVLELSTGWVVTENNSGAALTGLTVDTSARTLVFNNKALVGMATERGTVAGTASFGSNATTPACGA